MAGQDKLLAEVGGRPLLAWTLAAFEAAPDVGRIVVVTSRTGWRRALRRGCRRRWSVVAGGDRRQASVAAGVAAFADAPDDRVLLVHDGARPLVSAATIAEVVDGDPRARRGDPGHPGRGDAQATRWRTSSGTVDRSGLAAAQTPQGVTAGVLRAAYRRFPPDAPETWTDEASLLEACTIPVHAVLGDPDNLKVTCPPTWIARGRSGRPGRAPAGDRRTTSHPFGPGIGLRSAASSSPTRPGSTATPTVTSRSTRSATPCWARPAWGISADSSRPARRRRRTSPARRCSPRSRRGSRRRAGRSAAWT